MNTKAIRALLLLPLLLYSAKAFALPEELRRGAAHPQELADEAASDTTPALDLKTPATTSFWDSIFEAVPRVLFGVQLNAPDAIDPAPYSRNLTTKFRPASNTKLFTSAIALERLGADYRFETKMIWQETPDGIATGMTVIGSGDPSWGLWDTQVGQYSEVRQLVDRLIEAGVRRVEGPITLSASDPRWAKVRYPNGWDADEYTACYGALPQAFNLQLNCATYSVTSLTAGAWKEFGVSTPVTVALTRAARTSIQIVSELNADGVPASFRIQGTVARGLRTSALASWILPIGNTESWLRRVLINELARAGITYSVRIQSTTAAQATTEKTASYFSRTVGEIIKPFMKDSINLVGEAFFKKVGEIESGGANSPADPQSDLIDAGIQSMRAFLPELPASDAVFNDGSGVSRLNLVTPMHVLGVLQYLKARRDFPILWDALPIAGVDGTLKTRMRATPAAGVLRAKTGTLSGVYALSGFVPRTDSTGQITEFVPFVTLTETTSSQRVNARGTQDRFGAELTARVNPPLLPNQ